MNIAIAACDRNLGIGKNGSIPFTSDLLFFKECTIGSSIIMGRKTWESIGSKPLPQRNNIIVSTTLPDGVFSKEKNGQTFTVVHSLTKALELAKDFSSHNFIIGGESIYKYMMEKFRLDAVVLTKYNEVYDCDTFFPASIQYLERIFDRFKLYQIPGADHYRIVYYNFGHESIKDKVKQAHEL